MAPLSSNNFEVWTSDDPVTVMDMAPLDFGSRFTWLRLGVALVWLVFGLVFKALGALPRHRQIVGRVLGERSAGTVTALVAVGEIAIAAWMIWGHFLPLCMVVQTLVLLAMNTLELRYARDLLVSPWGMVAANVGFLSAGWYVTIASP